MQLLQHFKAAVPIIGLVEQIGAHGPDIGIPSAVNPWIHWQHSHAQSLKQANGSALGIADEQDHIPIFENSPVVFSRLAAIKNETSSVWKLPFQSLALQAFATDA